MKQDDGASEEERRTFMSQGVQRDFLGHGGSDWTPGEKEG